MSQVIQLDSILSQVENTQVQIYSANTITETRDQLDFAIDSQESVSALSLSYIISPSGIINVSSFETDTQLRFTVTVFADTIEPTTSFGDIVQLSMEIDGVPFPAIESTLVIPAPNVLKKLAPLSIAPTTNFGISSFVDNIHRLLVFKDDNISKVGNNDAVVISGGIRLNPATTVSSEASSGEASLPEAPVGFLSINIQGTDYKIPYYNT